MAKEAMNKVNYMRFAQRARGNSVTQVTVNREDRSGQVLFRYNAKALRSKKLLAGEWVVSKKDREAAEVKKREDEFLERLRKDFHVKKASGFGGQNGSDTDGSDTDGADADGAEAADDKAPATDAAGS